jgi:glucose-1-phosphate thymidylyltransferase
MRGILLAGGMGTRLNPITRTVNKHLVPIYDKPMVYYPLTTLILAGVKDICVVSTQSGVEQFTRLLADGSQWGLNISYAVQKEAVGIANGIKIALTTFETEQSCLVILGDNVFYGHGLGRNISEVIGSDTCVVWTQKVDNPQFFGVLKINQNNEIEAIVEKPIGKFSDLAITGLYYFPNDLKEIVAKGKKSLRGEYEITEILNFYMDKKRIANERLSRGVYWIDAGTADNLLEVGQFVKSVQTRQGQLIGSPDEASWRMGNIHHSQFSLLVSNMKDSEYKSQLAKLITQ